jgi:hypothetical protein
MRHRLFSLGPALALLLALVPMVARASASSFIGEFKAIKLIASTVPSNGDVNPYGVAVVQATTGDLVRDHILVSNFNNKANLQGTGTTIVEIAPDGTRKVFATIKSSDLHGDCPGGVGLSTALIALKQGWVIVGSLPTSDGTAATAKAGCLIVLNNNGHVVETISGNPINGPWDMTAVEEGSHAALFVANVLNGTVAAHGNTVNHGTVVRINLTVSSGQMPHVDSKTIVASDFPERTDPAALVIGPTGLGFSDGTLYVADTLANRLAAIPNVMARETSAGNGQTVSTKGAINSPLGLTIAPNGDILLANGGDGNLVEVTPAGSQVAVKTVEPAGAGTLFGLAIAPDKEGIYFVDDGTNQLKLFH